MEAKGYSQTVPCPIPEVEGKKTTTHCVPPTVGVVARSWRCGTAMDGILLLRSKPWSACCRRAAPGPPQRPPVQRRFCGCAAHRRLVAIGAPLAGLLGVPVASAKSVVKPSQGDWTSPGLAVPESEDQPRFLRLESGVRVQIIADGDGAVVEPGDVVLLDYVLRRSNGYFIYSTVEGVSFQPSDVPVGPVSLVVGAPTVAGLSEGLQGMRKGGKRRILVPPSLGYQARPDAEPQPPTFSTQRQLLAHKDEPVLFEVLLRRITRDGNAL